VLVELPTHHSTLLLAGALAAVCVALALMGRCALGSVALTNVPTRADERSDTRGRT
jgi:hypothetical protein